MSNEYESDLKQCRTCDTKSKKLKCLFKTSRNEKLSPADMLMGCAAVQVSKDDGLPPTICYKCSSQLKESYQFKLQCEVRDRIFRKVINNATLIKTDMRVEDDLFERVEVDNGNYCEKRLEADIDIKVDIIPKTEDSRSGEDMDPTFFEDNSDHSYVPDDQTDMQLPELRAAQESEDLIGIHRCKICIRDFSCLSNLQRHMKIHCPRNKKLYICTLCNKTVARKEVLKRHIMAYHVKTKPHICKTCARGFIDVDVLYKHEKFCTGQKPYICDLCNTSFTREDSLQVHLRLHDGNVLKNPVLDELDNIDNYIRVQEIKPERLNGSVDNEKVAKETFSKNTEFVVVKKEKKSNKRGWKQERLTNDKFTCKDCGEEFKGPFNYKHHMINKHKEPNPFVCTLCPKVFPRFDKYKKHINCHKEREYPCELCPRKFTCKSLLTKHLNTRHNEDREKMFPCNNCKKAFLSERSRKLHMNNFCLPNPIYNCKRCLIVFPTKEDLVKHLRLANECSKRFLCSECGQRYAKKRDLTIHNMRRHTGERPFKCNHCDKAFAGTSNLRTHMKTHTGEKNHICIVCGKGFARAYMLSVHMRTHPGEKPYICEHCSEGFVHNHALRLHMQEHHPDIIKPKYLSL